MKNFIAIMLLSIGFVSSRANKLNMAPWMEGKIQQQVFAITKVMFHDVTIRLQPQDSMLIAL